MIQDKQYNIWQISREMSPFAEAGGIKDVVAGLSEALAIKNHKVTVVLPMYKFLQNNNQYEHLFDIELLMESESHIVAVYKFNHKNIRILFLSADCYFSKEQVYTYSRNEELLNSSFTYGKGHIDCNLMNLILQRGALETAFQMGEKPDLFHLHDGHCGFLPAIMRFDKRYNSFFEYTTTLLTIHNGGVIYQQNIPSKAEVLALTGLPEKVIKNFKMEYGYNPILCAGIFGFLNTVSEEYAREVLDLSDENSGALGKMLNKHNIKLYGITNGIDLLLYRDPPIPGLPMPEPDSPGLFWKKEYKTSLFNSLEGLSGQYNVYGSLIKDQELPLITMQSRITYQKGIDVFLDSMDLLFQKKKDINILIVGEGEYLYEEKLAAFANGRNNFCYIRKYDFNLSRHLFAAGDFFLIPSRWEPCGLTDFIAQLYGNIPIVHETGGLKKTEDLINGFSYKENNPESLLERILTALDLYTGNSSELFKIRKNAVNMINEKYTWEKVLNEGYLPLYRKISIQSEK